MEKKTTRRDFIKKTGLGMGALTLSSGFGNLFGQPLNTYFHFDISLAQWSVRQALKNKTITNLDFPKYAKDKYGILGVEYVSFFFEKPATNKSYQKELKMRAEDEGVKNLLIMVGREGALGHNDKNQRLKSVDAHKRWIEAAHAIGCHSVRVDAKGNGSREDMLKYNAESFTALSEFAKDFGLNVILENHGGFSSDGHWVVELMNKVNLPNCGTLPDFGNFCIEGKKNDCKNEYDRYKGMKDMMPFAKAVSAKSYHFDDKGNETTIDFKRMLEIVKKHNYSDYIGIEYEGEIMSPDDGIMATKRLLERVRSELAY
ncbi:sugar phosphate isomerase/epimerase family protein [Seonamhaeicola maritimus]|uniref:Sugar phosphate isomerase/epimerase n=1 Tax=Seonamhaeicola maritimus TaxID=2591822 RepID=A0A5C7GGG1_9FLAO|nr:sugar phosphate isomerase/epimerase family protein [Seonamhaeicola maritimus]TXG36746.1 sugar phosphate isomerase/epimerase [Seonamhaeicola maritimus]